MAGRLVYALFMLLALGVFVGARRALPQSLALAAVPWRKRVLLALVAFVGGALGAKVPFVLGLVSTNTLWLADGKTITTGLMAAYVAVELAKLALGIAVKTGDTFALPLALALAVGRWGCFFNGCCYGQPTSLPWGVDFGDGIRRHPTQIYESLFHLILATFLWLLQRHDLLRYQRLKVYLLAYCAFRFSTEFIRPEAVWALGLTFYQWVTVLFAVGLTVQWGLDQRRKAGEASGTSLQVG